MVESQSVAWLTHLHSMTSLSTTREYRKFQRTHWKTSLLGDRKFMRFSLILMVLFGGDNKTQDCLLVNLLWLDKIWTEIFNTKEHQRRRKEGNCLLSIDKYKRGKRRGKSVRCLVDSLVRLTSFSMSREHAGSQISSGEKSSCNSK